MIRGRGAGDRVGDAVGDGVAEGVAEAVGEAVGVADGLGEPTARMAPPLPQAVASSSTVRARRALIRPA